MVLNKLNQESDLRMTIVKLALLLSVLLHAPNLYADPAEKIAVVELQSVIKAVIASSKGEALMRDAATGVNQLVQIGDIFNKLNRANHVSLSVDTKIRASKIESVRAEIVEPLGEALLEEMTLLVGGYADSRGFTTVYQRDANVFYLDPGVEDITLGLVQQIKADPELKASSDWIKISEEIITSYQHDEQ